MLNFDRYVELKKKGVLELTKKGNAFVIKVFRFNPESGEKLLPEEIGTDIKQLENIKRNLTKGIKGIDALINDLKSL